MSTDHETNLRLLTIEQQLTRISHQLGLDCPPMPGGMTEAGGAVPADVIELKRAGNAIGAIKRLREHTGLDLASAKAVVDRIA